MLNKRKVRREMALLTAEAGFALRLAKGHKTHGRIEQADLQMDKALRLHTRMKKLKEELCE
jgi:hypothetical protein